MPPLPRTLAIIACLVTIYSGCAAPCTQPDGRHRSDVLDTLFHRRHPDAVAHASCDPVMRLARDLTVIEDDLRRDGTITVKQPDVWGDGNLMTFLQEYDGLLAKRTGEFSETLSAYIARSDRAEFDSTTGLAVALAGKDAQAAAASPAPITFSPALPNVLGLLDTGAKPTKPGVGVEPTELARQQSTYIDVCQALRRRHMGDDNSRAAGYGLYKFRVPVSILPGRETTRGHSAVVTLRAQLVVNEAHLRYTYPKLVIADLVDKLTTPIRADWNKKVNLKEVIAQFTELSAKLRGAADEAEDLKMKLPMTPPGADKSKLTTSLAEIARAFGSIAGRIDAQLIILNTPCANYAEPFAVLECLKEQSKVTIEEYKSLKAKIPPRGMAGADLDRDSDANLSLKVQAAEQSLLGPELKQAAALAHPGGDITFPDVPLVYGSPSITALREVAEKHLKLELDDSGKPPIQELRAFLFKYLGQVHTVLEENHLYSGPQSDIINCAAQHVVSGQLKSVDVTRCAWLSNVGCDIQEEMKQVGWLLALQSGLLDRNLKKIVEEGGLKGEIPGEDVALSKDPQLRFYDLQEEAHREVRLHLWDVIIHKMFPLSVFTLDPQVEEQNVYEAFSRRREMQLALAYSVASGRFNTSQKMAFSRQLALEQADIGLNRTCVGFSHGSDVFGWYFYPRVQAPPTESTNIGALARTIWSTGPTEHYDQKHRKLEPGMRECEVLVAMPSFVTQVSFDVTTNWESLAHPGISKRSYEEMVGQGARIHQLRSNLGGFCNAACYRPGDINRLVSRVDQLEQMVGLQTHLVSVPYEYEQSGTDLFDTGSTHLKPVVTGFYGLEFLQPDTKEKTGLEAYFFITGKNFHPTLTHLITGGRESHSLAETAGGKADVEVINRELLRVRVAGINDSLSRKEGIQVRVGTPAGLSNPLTVTRSSPPKETPPPGWSFKDFAASATLDDVCCGTMNRFNIESGQRLLGISHNFTVPFPNNMNGLFLAEITAAKKDGTAITFRGEKRVTTAAVRLDFHPHPSGRPELAEWTVDWPTLQTELINAINAKLPDIRHEQFKLQITGYVTFDKWPITKVLNTIDVTVEPCDCACPNGMGATGREQSNRDLIPPPSPEPPSTQQKPGRELIPLDPPVAPQTKKPGAASGTELFRENRFRENLKTGQVQFEVQDRTAHWGVAR